MDERNMWIDIITKLYKDLHMSDRVMHSSKESDKKRDRILKYFDRLERVHQKVARSKNKKDLKLLETFYHNLYVIKPEDIPNSYFEHEKQIMRERGYGDIEITPNRKEILVNQIIEDQEESLDKWVEYFLFDEESKSYEMWEKYWVFQGLQQLGKFNKETGKFSKRDKHTVYPFPPVEREAIFTTLKLMENYIKDRKGDEEIRSALGSGNFKTLYEYSIKMIMNKGEKKNSSTEGKWVKYEQGSDYHILRDSLQGYYTGWCTAAGENFAKGQLENGDFYVYYTLDENGEAKVPRIAIRMDGHNTIGEIRGIAENQNMEAEMMPILDKKLEEFPDRDKYKKKEYDMQLLTTIDNKVQKGFELTKEELRFLYEIDDKIEGFGWEQDPRIEEIIDKRNCKQDMACIFDCMEENIGFEYYDDFKNPNIKVYLGNIFYDADCENIDFSYLKFVGGNVYMDSIVEVNSLKLPKHIEGTLTLAHLKKFGQFILPQAIGGDLNLSGLESAEGLMLPSKIGGTLDLRGLTRAEGLVLPQKINGSLLLDNLESEKDLILPQEIGEDLELGSLISPEGLTLPNKIGRDLVLCGLTSVKGITWPQKIGGDLYLNGLITAKGVILPNEIGRDLDLNNLKSAEDLILPQKINGSLLLDSLESAEGLMLPEEIGEYLYLRGLKNAKGLILPESFSLGNLIASSNLIKEIFAHPGKYYRNYMQNDMKEDKNSGEFTVRHFR